MRLLSSRQLHTLLLPVLTWATTAVATIAAMEYLCELDQNTDRFSRFATLFKAFGVSLVAVVAFRINPAPDPDLANTDQTHSGASTVLITIPFTFDHSLYHFFTMLPQARFSASGKPIRSCCATPIDWCVAGERAAVQGEQALLVRPRPREAPPRAWQPGGAGGGPVGLRHQD